MGTNVAFNWIGSNGIGVWVRLFAVGSDPPGFPPDGTIIRFNRFKCNSEDIVDEGTNTVIQSNWSSC